GAGGWRGRLGRGLGERVAVGLLRGADAAADVRQGARLLGRRALRRSERLGVRRRAAAGDRRRPADVPGAARGGRRRGRRHGEGGAAHLALRARRFSGGLRRRPPAGWRRLSRRRRVSRRRRRLRWRRRLGGMVMKRGLARIWAHLACDARDVRRLFPDESLRRIEQAVSEGERGHSAEIRIAIEASLPWHRAARGVTPHDRALEVFSELRVWDTEGNNGVLVYLLVADHAIEIVADRAAL